MLKSLNEEFELEETRLADVPEMVPQELIFELPLYTSVKIRDIYLFESLFKPGRARIDGFCTDCGKVSVFHSASDHTTLLINNNISQMAGVQLVDFVCQRDVNHKIVIVIKCKIRTQHLAVGNGRSREVMIGEVTKIGQSPSHADIAIGNLKKMLPILKGQDRRELIRANGLAAVGVHIGAFVYLRRVFERLLDRAKVRSGVEIDNDVYRTSRTVERIELLKHHLPPFMVENKRVYGLLSKGIHELDEKTCGKLYELLNQSSLLMLEQEKDLAEKQSLEANLKSAIQNLNLEDLK